MDRIAIYARCSTAEQTLDVPVRRVAAQYLAIGRGP